MRRWVIRRKRDGRYWKDIKNSFGIRFVRDINAANPMFRYEAEDCLDSGEEIVPVDVTVKLAKGGKHGGE